MNEDLELAARYSRWETEDLARSATAEAAEFTPAALAAIRRELERRGHAVGPATATAATSAAARVPRGVGGFLLLLILAVAWESISGLGFVLVCMMNETLHSPGSVLIAAGLACFEAYGMFCCVLLVRKDRRAPRQAALWFVAGAAFYIVFSVHNYLFPETLGPFFLSDISLIGITLTFRIIYCGIWLSYLAQSQRVKATFGTAALW